jgi:hypothetical protein
MHAQQSHYDHPHMPPTTSVGYLSGKEPLNGPCHLWVIIAPQRRPHRARQARLPYHTVPRPHHLHCQSSYRRAVPPLAGRMHDGTQLPPMERDQSCQAPQVMQAWTLRRYTMRRLTTQRSFGRTTASECARCRYPASIRVCSLASCARMKRTGSTFDKG